MIGAGFAGLAAADALVEAGADVTVLEARDRVGGRVHSRRLAERRRDRVWAQTSSRQTTTCCAGYAGASGSTIVSRGMRYSEREPRGVETTPEAVGDVAEHGARHGAAAHATGRRSRSPRCSTRSTSTTAAREAVRARIEVSSAYDAADIDARVLGHFGVELRRPGVGPDRGGQRRHRARPGREPRRPHPPVDAGRVDRPGRRRRGRPHGRAASSSPTTRIIARARRDPEDAAVRAGPADRQARRAGAGCRSRPRRSCSFR